MQRHVREKCQSEESGADKERSQACKMERARLNSTLYVPAPNSGSRKIEKKVSNCADFCDSNYKDNLANMASRFIVQKMSA